MNALDDISRRRNRHRFETQPFELDCETDGCGARGIFETRAQTFGWAMILDKSAQPPQVRIFCPRCASLPQRSPRR